MLWVAGDSDQSPWQSTPAFGHGVPIDHDNHTKTSGPSKGIFFEYNLVAWNHGWTCCLRAKAMANGYKEVGATKACKRLWCLKRNGGISWRGTIGTPLVTVGAW